MVLSRNGEALTTLGRLKIGVKGCKELGAAHLTGNVVYSASNEHVILINEAGHFFISNPSKSTSFHNMNMYTFAERLLKELI